MLFPRVALAGLVTMTLAGSAWAVTTGEAQESAVMQHTTVTLPQAIATAEQHTGGKAFDAGTDIDHGKPRIVVETNGARGVQTVIIDAQNGRVVGGHAGAEAD